MTARVLIVDDEKWICTILGSYLEDLGYSIETVLTLTDARSHVFSDRRPDLLVLDASLPDGTGFSLIKEMRSQAATKDIPIILITAHTGRFSNIDPQSMPDEWMIKPFNLKDIKAHIEHHLQRTAGSAG